MKFKIEELCNLTMCQAAMLIRTKMISSVDLVVACAKRIEKKSALNCFISHDIDHALLQAEASAARQKNGTLRGVFDGIPIAVKDNFCTRHLNTTAASKMLANYKSPFESTPTQRLLDQGAIILGKLNMDEFGMGSGTMFSESGPCYNPWSRFATETNKQKQIRLSPGGSSGGSAAAVASGCCFMALGSDTGGSVRQPAAWCGTVGLKPSYGRISRHGLISYASSLDTVGVLTRSVGDAALALDAIAGPDEWDSTCIQKPVAPDFFAGSLGMSPSNMNVNPVHSLKGMKVGIPAQFHVEGMEASIIKVWEDTIALLQDAGAEIKTVSLPLIPYTLPAYIVLASAEASSNLARYDGVRYGARATDYSVHTLDGATENIFADHSRLHQLYTATRTENFGDEVKRRILAGCFVLSAEAKQEYYELAQWVRSKFVQELDAVFQEQVDVLICPTAPLLPFDMDDRQAPDDPAALFLNDIMTVPASLAGVPSISVPAAMVKHSMLDIEVPVGIQVMSKFNGEPAMLQTAQCIETFVNLVSN